MWIKHEYITCTWWLYATSTSTYSTHSVPGPVEVGLIGMTTILIREERNRVRRCQHCRGCRGVWINFQWQLPNQVYHPPWLVCHFIRLTYTATTAGITQLSLVRSVHGIIIIIIILFIIYLYINIITGRQRPYVFIHGQRDAFAISIALIRFYMHKNIDLIHV